MAIDKANIYIIGCGNILFGDDGFGPAVVEYLQKEYKFGEDVCVIDAGTGVRNILFNILLSENKPKKIIIVDSMDFGEKPGSIFEIPVKELPDNKIDDFSFHQLPTSNLLKELEDFCNIDIIILACQVESIPQEVSHSLSNTLKSVIPVACEKIKEIVDAKTY